MDWDTFDSQPTDDKIEMLVMALNARLGRLPTEAEVMLFIFGNKEDRLTVWNAS